MFPYELYKVVHLVAMFLAFAAIGAAAIYASVQPETKGTTTRKFLGIVHGVAMFVILIGGFGMLARLGIIKGWPGWVWGKIVIWLLVAAVVVLPYRMPGRARPMFFLAPLLGLVAAYLAIYKPF